MEISPEGLLKRFSYPRDFNIEKEKLSTPQISDALKDIIDYEWVIPGVKPLNDEFKIMGKAVTVQTSSYDWGTVLKAIDIAEKGDILFINTEKDDSAVWGELTSKTAQTKGLAGTVVYGAVRDVAAIRKLNYPVFTKSIVPNAGLPLAEGMVNEPVKCGDVTVNPGDWIVGDDCGIIVISAKHFSRTINKSLQIKEDEGEIIKKIESGWSLSKILDI